MNRPVAEWRKDLVKPRRRVKRVKEMPPFGIGIARRSAKTHLVCRYCRKEPRYRWGRCKTCHNANVNAKAALKRAVRPCEQCRGNFQPYRSDQRFCSDKCSLTKRNPNWRYAKPQKRKCASCNTEFMATAKDQSCCSGPCRTKKRSMGKPRTGVTVVPKTCQGCGAGFGAKPYFAKMGQAKFCSTKCWYDFMSAQKRAANKSRLVERPRGSGSRGRGWKKLSKRITVEKFNWTCQGTCEKPECPFTVLLHCDHIVPYHLMLTIEGLDPNAEINLTALCESCHMKKTLAERKLFGGNIVGFLRDARRIFRDMGPIKEALAHAGLLSEWHRRVSGIGEGL